MSHSDDGTLALHENDNNNGDENKGNDNDENKDDNKDESNNTGPTLTRIPSIITDCVICMETNKTHAFIPCGHYIACEKCANLMKLQGCPICSQNIQSIFKIYE